MFMTCLPFYWRRSVRFQHEDSDKCVASMRRCMSLTLACKHRFLAPSLFASSPTSLSSSFSTSSFAERPPADVCRQGLRGMQRQSTMRPLPALAAGHDVILHGWWRPGGAAEPMKKRGGDH
jgi:hypothetical protein